LTVTFVSRITTIFLFFILYVGNNTANAQLWRYLNVTPESEAKAEKDIEREASSVVHKKTIFEGDSVSYDIMTYTIRSFDDRIAKISLWEKPFSGHIFHIDMPGDKLAIADFTALAKVHHLSNDLLEIVYSPRGGSDQGFDNVLILGVENGKFRIVMDILCINEYTDVGKYGLYNLHLKLKGKNIDNYQLAITVNDMLSSNNKGDKSFNKTAKFDLKFDRDKKVFYNEIKHVDGKFEFYDDKIGKTKTLHLTGVYPSINLDQYVYYLVNEIWYSSYKSPTTGKYYLSTATNIAK